MRNCTFFCNVSLFKLYCANQNVPTDNCGEIRCVIVIKSIKKNDCGIYLWTNVLCLREAVIEKLMEMEWYADKKTVLKSSTAVNTEGCIIAGVKILRLKLQLIMLNMV